MARASTFAVVALMCLCGSALAFPDEFTMPQCSAVTTINPVVNTDRSAGATCGTVTTTTTQTYNICAGDLDCDGVCRAASTYGSACTSSCIDSETGMDLSCVNGFCRYKSGIDDDCLHDDDCNDSDGAGVCVNNKCQGSVALGGSCAVNACISGLYCDWDDICANVTALDAPCTDSLECVPGTVCNTKATTPTCQAWATLDAGAPSSSWRLCKSTQVSGGVCIQGAGVAGDTCNQNPATRLSKSCVSGACGCTGDMGMTCLSSEAAPSFAPEARAYATCMATSGCSAEADDDWEDSIDTEPYRCAYHACGTEWRAFNCAGWKWAIAVRTNSNADLLAAAADKYGCTFTNTNTNTNTNNGNSTDTNTSNDDDVVDMGNAAGTATASRLLAAVATVIAAAAAMMA